MKPWHLIHRNLYFRTTYLLLSGVRPVFVLEGTAPALKHAMISKRNEIQFRGAAPRKIAAETNVVNNPKKVSDKGRTRFNFILKQCEELIRSMGLQCVQGPGEAEAFCAHLNAAKLVDGVISQVGIEIFDAFKIPILNTTILTSSGFGLFRVWRTSGVPQFFDVNARHNQFNWRLSWCLRFGCCEQIVGFGPQ